VTRLRRDAGAVDDAACQAVRSARPFIDLNGCGQTGSVSDTAEMLAFTARHGIKPIIETFAMSDANRALEHTRAGKARFRAVLVA